MGEGAEGEEKEKKRGKKRKRDGGGERERERERMIIPFYVGINVFVECTCMWRGTSHLNSN